MFEGNVFFLIWENVIFTLSQLHNYITGVLSKLLKNGPFTNVMRI